MFSVRTNNEIAFVIEKMTKANIERMLIVFSKQYLNIPVQSNAKLANYFLGDLGISNHPGPFTSSFGMDVLQYVVDNFYRGKEPSSSYSGLFSTSEILFEDLFSNEFPLLANSLKRDGYIVKGTEIRKLLPTEIQEAKTETELFRFLDKLGFSQSKTHLQQSINNHSSSNWAAANGQFRTFIESLLMEICDKLSGSSCISAANAITSLSNLSPPFLAETLNEIKTANNGIDVGFVNGLWKRLHPQGSHPGTSDEEDCTFRYHISIVFAHYLMKRLINRLGISL